MKALKIIAVPFIAVPMVLVAGLGLLMAMLIGCEDDSANDGAFRVTGNDPELVSVAQNHAYRIGDAMRADGYDVELRGEYRVDFRNLDGRRGKFVPARKYTAVQTGDPAWRRITGHEVLHWYAGFVDEIQAHPPELAKYDPLNYWQDSEVK